MKKEQTIAGRILNSNIFLNLLAIVVMALFVGLWAGVSNATLFEAPKRNQLPLETEYTYSEGNSEDVWFNYDNGEEFYLQVEHYLRTQPNGTVLVFEEQFGKGNVRRVEQRFSQEEIWQQFEQELKADGKLAMERIQQNDVWFVVIVRQ